MSMISSKHSNTKTSVFNGGPSCRNNQQLSDDSHDLVSQAKIIWKDRYYGASNQMFLVIALLVYKYVHKNEMVFNPHCEQFIKPI